MSKSLSYNLLLLILKIKGLKKTFSQNPIDYKKLRKEDIQYPKDNYFKKRNSFQFNVLKTSVTEVPSLKSSKELLIFIPGGAFVSGPGKHHWDSIKYISKNSNQTIWLCDYPKAPEHKISEISNNIDNVYNEALKKYSSDSIIIIGDSVGGTLTISLIQRLVEKNIPLPLKIILMSPVVDATISSPLIDDIDKFDPMLSKNGVLSAKKMCCENNNLEDPLISPINGSFNNFPNTVLFIAENDITYPDQIIMSEIMELNGVNLEKVIGKEMPHIWPLLPIIKEGRVSLNHIINAINENK